MAAGAQRGCVAEATELGAHTAAYRLSCQRAAAERCEHAHVRMQRHVRSPSRTRPAASEGAPRAAAARRHDEQRGGGGDDGLRRGAQRRRFQRWVARSAANFPRSEFARRATAVERRRIYSSRRNFSTRAGANETDRVTIENFFSETETDCERPAPARLGTCTCLLL